MRIKSPYLSLAGLGIGFLAILAVNMVVAPGTQTSEAESYQSKPGQTLPAPSGTAPSPTVSSSTDSSTPTPSPSSKTSGTPVTPKPGPQFPAKVVYAGRAKSSGPSVAVAILRSRAAAYLCDGRASEAWLTGSARDGRVRLDGKHQAKLEARLSTTGKLVGTFSLAGRKYSFKITTAGPPAGLYRATNGSRTTIGWIVLPDGSQVGLANRSGTVSPAPKLRPGQDVMMAGQHLTPAPVRGDENSLS
jgi:hypothetical protein